jgi:predicted Fe-S protein YdhL (DUF1289 family)
MFAGSGHGRRMNPPGPPRAIRTPCVQVCFVDPDSGLCLGCRRTLPEIAQWSRLSDAERDRVMAELPARLERIAPEKRA